MPPSHEQRLERARQSLEGLSVGDAFGECWFHVLDGNVFDLLRNHALPASPWEYTDDSQMALSVFDTLRRFQGIYQNGLARSFGERYDMSRGYGSAMHNLLPRLREGESWAELSKQLFAGQGSFGNGAAM